ALMAAIPWTVVTAKENAEERAEAWNHCADLARQADILAEFAADLKRLGVTGEERNTKLVFLAVVSRLFERPISIAAKGPSSGGKSFLVERTLSFFPPAAYFARTSMSDHALAYSKEPLMHRVLVLYEAAGMASDKASYLMRSLLSEGRLC